MKKLFLAALVLNLVVWLWSQRQAPEVIESLLSPDVGVVRLVDEAAVRAFAGGADSASASRVEHGAVTPPEPALSAGSEPWTAPPVLTAGGEPPADATSPMSAALSALQPIATARELPVPDVPSVTVATPDGLAEAPSAGIEALRETEGRLPSDAASPIRGVVATDPVPALIAAESLTDPEVPTEPPDAALVAQPSQPLRGVDADAALRDQPAPPATPAAPRAPAVCETVGPFAQRGLADAFVASLPALVAADGIREDRVARPARYWVLGPAQPSKEAAAAYVGTLQAAGIKDAWRAQSGTFVGRLVVGVFSTEENARRHAAMLAGKGVATEIRRQQAEESRWWVDLRRADEAAPALDLAEGLQVTRRECARVAAP
jgi:hypothetical protein